jgi:type IV pilus assembly protein PilM
MSNIFYRDEPIIGIDVSQTSIKAMMVDSKHWQVIGYGSIDLDPTEAAKSLSGDGTYLTQNLKKLFSEKSIGHMNSEHAVLSIPSAKTYTRTFTIPAKSESNLSEAISLEAEQYIPVPLSQLYIDHQIIERPKDSISIQLCAVPKTVVDSCVNAVRGAGLSVVMVEPGVNAIARLLTVTEDATLPTVIVDVGPATTDIAILDGTVRVSGNVAVGGNTFTLEIARKLSVPLENAHQMKVQHGLNVGPRQAKLLAALEPSLRQITVEMRKMMRYYNERLDANKKLEQVLIVGGGSNIPGLGEYFTNALVMPARVASPWQILNFGNLEQPAKQFKSRYITVAGLASVKPKEIFA